MSTLKDPVDFLHGLLRHALDAADPLKTVPSCLPADLFDGEKDGRIIVIGAGKASAAMARAVEQAAPPAAKDRLEGLVVTRYGYGVPTEKIEIIEAGHPVPDEQGIKACARILETVKNLREQDTVVALISGGGSALLSWPAPAVEATEKRAINKALLKCGAAIHEINCVRKHLSAIKGGQLALEIHPARLVTLVISDVPGDDPAVVASGPTLPDPTTQAQALAVIEKYGIEISQAVRGWLEDPANETPKPNDPRFAEMNHQVHLVSCAKESLDAAAGFANSQGIETIILGDDIEGEAREVGAEHIHKARGYLSSARPVVLLSGGETTVTVRGQGKGGRNTEYLLAAVMEAKGENRLYGLACDTDGIDGSETNAGAFFTPKTLSRAQECEVEAQNCLASNNAYHFFEAAGGLINTGPTFTNVNDFRAILIV